MGIFDWFSGKKKKTSNAKAPAVKKVLAKKKKNKNVENNNGLNLFYKNGKLEKEFTLKEGKLHGIEKLYYPSGEIMQEAKYKNDEYHGIAKTYHENGKLKGKLKWKNGKQDGIYKVYYENGKLKQEGSFKDGEVDGIYKVYYENGKLKQEGNFKDGKEDGIFQFYYPNGKKEAEENYKNGKLTELDDYNEDPNAFEFEKIVSDFDKSMSKYRSWYDIILERSDTMKNWAEIQKVSLKEMRDEWTQSHFEEYQSKGGEKKEAIEGIITRLESYGYIYTSFQDFLIKVNSLLIKMSKDHAKLVTNMLEEKLYWDMASVQASLMGSILFAQSLGMEDAEIMKYASIESFPEYVPGKTHEETMDDIERKHGLRD